MWAQRTFKRTFTPLSVYFIPLYLFESVDFNYNTYIFKGSEFKSEISNSAALQSVIYLFIYFYRGVCSYITFTWFYAAFIKNKNNKNIFFWCSHLRSDKMRCTKSPL